MIGVTLMGRKRASWIREKTQVDDIVQITKKKWASAGHVMSRTRNRWTKRVTEYTKRQVQKGKSNKITRWGDEIRKFGAKKWT